MASPDYYRKSSMGGGRSNDALPRLSLDKIMVLLVVCFFMGVYMPSFMEWGLMEAGSLGEGSGKGSTAAIKESIDALKDQVIQLMDRMKIAEAKSDEAFAENERLRLDNKVENANLKSLNKAKNDDIRGLNARIQDLEGKAKEADASRGLQEQLNAAQQERQNALDQVAKANGEKGRLEKQVEELKKQLKTAGDGKGDAESHDRRQLALASVPESKLLNDYWQDIIKGLFNLANDNPADLLKKLDTEDPLQVFVEDVSTYECPDPVKRLTQPDVRNLKVANRFREGKGFIFFQHLRKAGGTGFCDLAERNMPDAVPKYYCMPDDRGSLATPPWNMAWLMETMHKKKFRIAANEWDAFPRSLFGIEEAVFATTMRDPTDRWYSQYRFEHLEHRDGSSQNATRMPFDKWYDHSWNMGDNYYVKTFLGGENPPDEKVLAPKGPNGNPTVHGNFYWTYDKYQDTAISWEDFVQSIDTLRRFHLVLIMEWLDYSDHMIEEVLGWKEKPRQVLPHEGQVKRADKKSKSARELLEADVYNHVREDNALDHLFYHIGRRIFLERHACGAIA